MASSAVDVAVQRLAILVVLGLFGYALSATTVVPCGAVPLQPRCSVALHPGPVEDTLGIVEVDGTRTYSSTGQLLLTTVSVDSDLGLRDLVSAVLSREVDRLPREVLFPRGTGVDEVRRANRALMDESQVVAAGAALRHLGHEVDLTSTGAEVVETLEASPAAAALEVGDVVIGVDDEEVRSAEDAIRAVRHLSAGDGVRLRIVRGAVGEPVDIELTLAEDPEDPGGGRIGALLTDRVDLPVDVSIDTGRIGGPSAGLMFALAVVDLLSPEDLTAGAVIAGTGSIDLDGRIGAMGGVRQKLVAASSRSQRPASVFLVPAENEAEARRAPVGRRVLVVPVRDLADAVAALETLRTGDRPPGSFVVGPG